MNSKTQGKSMTLNEFQNAALETAIYPDCGRNIVYPILKLSGEAGEVSEALGKAIRDEGFTGFDAAKMTVMKRAQITKELGDVLWYVASVAYELGHSLDDVAQWNLDKLASRKERGTLSGSGDER